MPLAPLPFHAFAEIALTAVDGTDWASAIEHVTSQLATLLNTDAVLLEKRARQWVPLAGHVADVDASEWHTRLTAVPTAKPALFSLLGEPGEGTFTVISLTAPSGPELALVLGGDWTADSSTLKVFALLVSIALESLRQRDERRDAERRLLAGYAAARRWSRVGDVGTVAQQIVDGIADLVEADRVSLALFDAGKGALSIAATHGYPHADVSDVAIAPGAWVIGHVYERAAPVFVNDARLYPGPPRLQYRAPAFAVVPLNAGPETIGVLSVTEKRDLRPFGPEAQALLRGISAVAALAIVAARSRAEAARLAYAATVDSVTHLLNRPYFDTRLHQEVERCKREGTALAVLIGDIDNFKSVNDSSGHQVGDEVLRVVGGIVRSAVRVFDVCARYGGDEFAILMPNCDRTSALACAERIRLRIAQYDGTTHSAGLPQLTMSIGVAVIEQDEDGPALMARADRHLYQAKADGKNVVRGESLPNPVPSAGSAPADAGVALARGPYVLLAGMNDARAQACANIIRPLGVRMSIAHGSHAAQSFIQQHGPPVVLIADLPSPDAEAFDLIDTLRDTRTEIIVSSGSREVTEYAAARLRGRHARVLSSAAPPSVLRTMVEKVLQRQGHETRDAAIDPVSPVARDANRIIETLVEQTRRHIDAPGVAVYLKAPSDTGFRTSLSWNSDAVPHVPRVLPRAVDCVMQSGRPLILPDPTSTETSDLAREVPEDGTRGLVAVPIELDNAVAGAICIFDVMPLTLNDRALSALIALGREPFGAATPRAVDDGAAPQFRDRAVDRRADAASVSAISAARARIDFPPAILERSGGEFAVARELARARRERRELSVVLFDVGPAADDPAALLSSDERLEAVSDTLLRAIRQSDLPIRWTSNELLVVLPGLKGSEARVVAERVRAALQAASRHRLAVSGGVAELDSEERFADVVDRARQKVAMAVGRGHNRVV